MNTPIDLSQKLTQYEDVETAIAVYKEALYIISQYEEVKKAALSLAESDMTANGENHRKTAIGSCGWTQPKTPQLDKSAWQAAILDNPQLAAIQAEFEAVEANLKMAQLPFMKLPEGKFFIR